MRFQRGGEVRAFIRREREAREIGLREMAKKIGVSPTYMSKVERDEVHAANRGQGSVDRAYPRMRSDELLAMGGGCPPTSLISSSGIPSKCRRCCEPPTV